MAQDKLLSLLIINFDVSNIQNFEFDVKIGISILVSISIVNFRRNRNSKKFHPNFVEILMF
jgi:hypothetical protein